MKFAIYPRVNVVADGQSFTSDQPLGEIHAPIALDRLQSLFAANMLIVSEWPDASPMQPEPPAPSVEAIVTSDQATSDPSTPEQSASDREPTIADLAALEFPGLKSRLAIALYEQGLETAELVRQFVNDGQDLEELAAIGRAAKREILDWLDQHLPEPEPQ